jgi:hypothetical protein
MQLKATEGTKEYMEELTEIEFKRLEQGSPILNPRPDDPTKPPSIFFIYGLSDMKAFHQRIVAKGMDEQGKFLGSLEYQRYKLKKETASWDAFNDAQVKKSKFPRGAFARQIPQRRAKICVLEAESRKLVKLIERAEREEAEKQKQTHLNTAKRFGGGIGKIANGRLVMMDGRKIVQNKQGENVFEDDGSSVAEYLKKVKKLKRQKFADKRTASTAN